MLSDVEIILTLVGGVTAWSGLLLWAVRWLLNDVIERYTEQTRAEIGRMDKASSTREQRISANSTNIVAQAEKLENRIDGLEKNKLIMEKEIVLQLENYQKREEALRELALIDAKLEHIQEGQNYLRLRLEQVCSSVTGNATPPPNPGNYS